MWLFQHFENKTTEADISARTTTVDKKWRGMDVKLTTYNLIINYLLLIHATDDLIAEIDSEIKRSQKGDLMYPLEYAQDFWTKYLRHGTVYSEDRLNGIFIEVLHGPILQSISGYWRKNGEDGLQDLVRQAK